MRGRRGGPLVHRPRAARRRSTAFNARAPPVPRCRHQPPSRSHQPASPPGHSPLLHRRLLSSQASQPHLTDARGPCFSCPTGHRDRLQALAVAAESAPGFNSRQYPSTLARCRCASGGSDLPASSALAVLSSSPSRALAHSRIHLHGSTPNPSPSPPHWRSARSQSRAGAGPSRSSARLGNGGGGGVGAAVSGSAAGRWGRWRGTRRTRLEEKEEEKAAGRRGAGGAGGGAARPRFC